MAEGRVRRFDKFLHLYKLHGSIDWQRRDGTIVRQGTHDGTVDWAAWGKMDEGKRSDWAKAQGNKELPLGIMPTEVKLSQTLAMPYAHLFRAFHQRLQVPQTFLIIIGYGFGDEHINSLINDAMTNPSLVLLVVSKGPSEDLKGRIAKYRSAGERAFLLESTFEDFADMYLPNVAWVDDQIRMLKAERELKTIDGNNEDGSGNGAKQ
ncbi:MAG TPA: hypothetical protein VLH56_14350 [Dissulfurispiraceae bacterium]|nr:hypothetical protein [Dissulfurispiraceae bacterium]